MAKYKFLDVLTGWNTSIEEMDIKETFIMNNKIFIQNVDLLHFATNELKVMRSLSLKKSYNRTFTLKIDYQKQLKEKLCKSIQNMQYSIYENNKLIACFSNYEIALKFATDNKLELAPLPAFKVSKYII